MGAGTPGEWAGGPVRPGPAIASARAGQRDPRRVPSFAARARPPASRLRRRPRARGGSRARASAHATDDAAPPDTAPAGGRLPPPGAVFGGRLPLAVGRQPLTVNLTVDRCRERL